MINNKKILSIIMARSGSKGLPHKNIKDMCGKPLMAWPIETSLNCKLIDYVFLSTDSNDYKEIGLKYSAEVNFLRPPHLASDTAKSIDVILDVINSLENVGKYFDYVIMLEPTSPLTEFLDIEKAICELENKEAIADSIVGIGLTESQNPIFTILKNKEGIIKTREAKDFSNLPRRQDIEDVYFLDGSFYISKVEALKKNKSFYHEKTLGFLMPKWKNFEIDDEVDFICVEALVRKYLINR